MNDGRPADAPPLPDLPVPAAHPVAPPALPLSVVGDVHLGPHDPAQTERFAAWLAARAAAGGTLVILGDLFDAWVGAPQAREPVPRRVLEALAAVARAGMHLVFMAGNRDFLFRSPAGLPMETWPDPSVTTLGGRRVLFTHGDLLCTADRGYLVLRRALRDWRGRSLSFLLPYRVKRRLAGGLRGQSRRAATGKAMGAMGIDYGEALRWMRAHGAAVLVAGHVHTGVHHRHPGPPEREILVLRDWQRGGGIVTFDGTRFALEAPQLP